MSTPVPSPDDDVIAAIRARSDNGSANWEDPISDARWLLDRLASLTAPYDADDVIELRCTLMANGSVRWVGDYDDAVWPGDDPPHILAVVPAGRLAVVTRERDELAATVRRVEMALLHAQSAREANLAVTAALKFEPAADPGSRG